MSVSDHDPTSFALLNLTTHQLQYLVAVSESETLGQAADTLRISQSALSQGLTELERKLGLELFERQGRNRVLTARGRTVVDFAGRILAATRDLTIWAGAAAKGERGTIRLGLIDIAAVNYFPDTLLEFRAERPGIELQLTVAPSAALSRRLLAGQLDAAVIVEPPGGNRDHLGAAGDGAEVDDDVARHGRTAATIANADFDLTPLLTEDLAIYRPAGAVAGGDGPGTVGRPGDWGPWVTFPTESHTRRHIAAALRLAGAEFRVVAESNQPEVLRQMVHLGMGWTVLPVLQAEAEPNPLVRARKQPLLTRRLVMAQRRGAGSDPATDELIGRLGVRAAETGTGK